MNLWKIAWRSVQQRWLASSLTALSMALGVMLVVAVVTIHGVVSAQFRNNATLGYNLIVGPKGGSLQLVLNSVYYLSRPVENLDYPFYLEFFPQPARDEQIRNSFGYQLHQALWRTSALSHVALTGTLPAGPYMVSHSEQLDRSKLQLGRDGQFAPYVEMVIPICMGDYLDRFRVVGTTPDMFDVLPKYGKPVEFAAGRNFRHWTPEHGFFEAVLGATVARELKLQVGDTISPSHGAPEGHSHENAFTVVGILRPTGTPQDRAVFVNMEGFLLMDEHIKPLPQNETDRELLERLNGSTAEALHPETAQQELPPSIRAPAVNRAQDAEADHRETLPLPPRSSATHEDHEEELHDEHRSQKAKSAHVVTEHDHEPHEDEEHLHAEERSTRRDPLPLEQREVTAALLRTVNSFVAPGLQNRINEGKEAQIVQPVREIYDLLDLIVSPVQRLLLVLTLLIIVVSGVSILVSIYNSMSERRHEIAVMRALGASRLTVMAVILGEALILAAGGGGVGWLAGHTLNWLASPIIEERTGVRLGFWDFAPPVNLLEFVGLEPSFDLPVYPELLLIPLLIVLAILVGMIPAIAAYRTDVAESLGK